MCTHCKCSEIAELREQIRVEQRVAREACEQANEQQARAKKAEDAFFFATMELSTPTSKEHIWQCLLNLASAIKHDVGSPDGYKGLGTRMIMNLFPCFDEETARYLFDLMDRD